MNGGTRKQLEGNGLANTRLMQRPMPASDGKPPCRAYHVWALAVRQADSSHGMRMVIGNAVAARPTKSRGAATNDDALATPMPMAFSVVLLPEVRMQPECRRAEVLWPKNVATTYAVVIST
jgi:hypothetical protein